MTRRNRIEAVVAPDFFAALADANRMAILARLATSESETMTVGEVAGCCDVDLSVVSRHLSKLRDAGLVSAERRGREVHYCCRAVEVAATLRALAEALESCCPREAGGETPPTSGCST